VNDLTSTKIDFLKKIGSDKVGHSGQTLLEHLIGTSTRLKEQGCPEYMQDAGLFHSVYGTVYFMPEGGLVENRQVIKDLIGEQAEEIVWWFCQLTSPRSIEIKECFVGQLQKDLIMLDLMNSEDIYSKSMMTWEEAYDL